MTNQQIKFIANVCLWRDKINGNTYHSVNILRISDNAILYCPFQYGYGEQYRYTALQTMFENRWLPEKYTKDNYYMFERKNNYPIYWNEKQGLKRECIANGQK